MYDLSNIFHLSKKKDQQKNSTSKEGKNQISKDQLSTLDNI